MYYCSCSSLGSESYMSYYTLFLVCFKTCLVWFACYVNHHFSCQYKIDTYKVPDERRCYLVDCILKWNNVVKQLWNKTACMFVLRLKVQNPFNTYQFTYTYNMCTQWIRGVYSSYLDISNKCIHKHWFFLCWIGFMPFLFYIANSLIIYWLNIHVKM